jgi:hypothetical protein
MALNPMKKKTADRINQAASRLSKTAVSKRTEQKRADAYVRHSNALDPDTARARSSSRHGAKASAS